MKIIFGILAMILVLIATVFGSPQPGFGRPGGRGGHIGNPPLINRPKPPQRQHAYL